MFGDTLTADEILKKHLDPWLNKIPDFFDVSNAYELVGKLKAQEIRKKRDIADAEDAITIEMDRPRSNETKKAKLQATNALRGDLLEIQAQLAEAEMQLKLLEYRKTMFTSAIYRMKLQYEL